MVEDKGRLLVYPGSDIPATELSGPEDTLTVAGKLDYSVAFLSGPAKISSCKYIVTYSSVTLSFISACGAFVSRLPDVTVNAPRALEAHHRIRGHTGKPGQVPWSLRGTPSGAA